MAKERKAVQGDCISSIAYENGFTIERIWNHEKNAELKTEREDPFHLMPGDKVFIPDKEHKELPVPTGQCHVFRRKGVPQYMRVQIRQLGRPRAKLEVLVAIDQASPVKRVTDSSGWLVVGIPPNAKSAKIDLPEGASYRVRLGHLHPVHTLSGVLGRLHKLGLYQGEIADQPTPQATEAIRKFQQAHDIDPADGQPGPATADKLESLAGA